MPKATTKVFFWSAGADETIFKTKNLECPWCAGVDRFSYTDKFGKGDSFCRHCGYHSGVDLLMKIKKFGYVDALRFMARFLIRFTKRKPTESRKHKSSLLR